MKKRTMLLVSAVLACLALTAAGCGGDDNKSSDTTAASTTTSTTDTSATSTDTTSKNATLLKIAADPSGQLAFNKTKLEGSAGRVSISMDNPSSVPHAVAIEGNGVDVDGQTVEKGGVSKVTAELKPGKYEFYCPVDGHKDAGMKGDLTVK